MVSFTSLLLILYNLLVFFSATVQRFCFRLSCFFPWLSANPFSDFDYFIIVVVVVYMFVLFEQISQTFFINLKAHPNWIFLTAVLVMASQRFNLLRTKRISLCSCQDIRALVHELDENQT